MFSTVALYENAIANNTLDLSSNFLALQTTKASVTVGIL